MVKIDECLSNKEKQMSNILKKRQERKQNLKINMNIDPFGDEFKKKLMESLKLSDSELSKLLGGLQRKEISANDLVNTVNNLNSNGKFQNQDGSVSRRWN